jgi:hypothetical protein
MLEAYIYTCVLRSGTLKDLELDGKVGFKISEHMNGTVSTKPFGYDVLRWISFSSISIQYDLYERMKSELRKKSKIGWKY